MKDFSIKVNTRIHVSTYCECCGTNSAKVCLSKEPAPRRFVCVSCWKRIQRQFNWWDDNSWLDDEISLPPESLVLRIFQMLGWNWMTFLVIMLMVSFLISIIHVL